MYTKIEAEAKARDAINKWAIGAGITGFIPGSSFVLASADYIIVAQVAKIFCVESYDKEAIVSAISATLAGNLMREGLSIIPIIGWIAKGLSAAAITKSLGEIIISYFKNLSPLPDNSRKENVASPAPPSNSPPKRDISNLYVKTFVLEDFNDNRREWFKLKVGTGGEKIFLNDNEVKFVSLESPLGREIYDSDPDLGDWIEYQTPGGWRCKIVISIDGINFLSENDKNKKKELLKEELELRAKKELEIRAKIKEYEDSVLKSKVNKDNDQIDSMDETRGYKRRCRNCGKFIYMKFDNDGRWRAYVSWDSEGVSKNQWKKHFCRK